MDVVHCLCQCRPLLHRRCPPPRPSKYNIRAVIQHKIPKQKSPPSQQSKPWVSLTTSQDNQDSSLLTLPQYPTTHSVPLASSLEVKPPIRAAHSFHAPHKPQPKLALLFLIKRTFPFRSVWDKYLSPEFSHLYNVYIHFKTKNSKLTHASNGSAHNASNDFVFSKIQGDIVVTDLERSKINSTIMIGHRFLKHVISSVPSTWGTNLVDAQLRLIHVALKHDPLNAHFIFLSDTSIPLKTFPYLYKTVTAHPNSSSFCFCPRWQSARAYETVVPEVRSIFPNASLFRKTEMWSILSRKHAKYLHQRMPMIRHLVALFGKSGRFLAPDEYIFGTLLLNAGAGFEDEIVNYHRRLEENNVEHQGHCNHYVYWPNLIQNSWQYKASPGLGRCSVPAKEEDEKQWIRRARVHAAFFRLLEKSNHSASSSSRNDSLPSLGMQEGEQHDNASRPLNTLIPPPSGRATLASYSNRSSLNATMLAKRHEELEQKLAELCKPLCIKLSPFYFKRVCEIDIALLMENPDILFARKFHAGGKVILVSKECGSKSQPLDIKKYLMCRLTREREQVKVMV